jgi:hypothetical protein
MPPEITRPERRQMLSRLVLVCPSLRFVVQLLDVVHKILGLRAAVAVFPLSVVIDTPHLVIQPDSAARADAHILTVLHAVPQQAHAIRARILAHARVQRIKVEPVFQRAVLDERLIRNLLVVIDQAVCEAQIQLRVGVFGGGAQHQDVAETLGLAVLAQHAVVVVGQGADEAELEVDFVGYVGHGGHDEFLEAVARVGAFRPGRLRLDGMDVAAQVETHMMCTSSGTLVSASLCS